MVDGLAEGALTLIFWWIIKDNPEQFSVQKTLKPSA